MRLGCFQKWPGKLICLQDCVSYGSANQEKHSPCFSALPSEVTRQVTIAGSQGLPLGLSVLSCGHPDRCHRPCLRVLLSNAQADLPPQPHHCSLHWGFVGPWDWRVQQRPAPPGAAPTAALCVVSVTLPSPFSSLLSGRLALGHSACRVRPAGWRGAVQHRATADLHHGQAVSSGSAPKHAVPKRQHLTNCAFCSLSHRPSPPGHSVQINGTSFLRPCPNEC